MSDRVDVVADQEKAQAAAQSENKEQAQAAAETELTAEATPATEAPEATQTPEAAVEESEAIAEPEVSQRPEAAVEESEAIAEPEVSQRPEAAVEEPEAIAEPEATAAEGSEVTEAASSDTPQELSEDDDDSDEAKRVVRMLAVGQQITGAVKRITEFGAFVDIGVGRDGLIHVSELSVRRVGKVADVLQEGQEVVAWIKKLDRDRNRISLTLIDPGTKTIRDLEKGEIVQGTVTRLMPYGAFVDIGIGRDALLHVREMSEKYVAKPEDVVKVGDEVEARIIDLSRRRGRVDLSLKGLGPEPEPEIEPVRVEPEAKAERQPEPEEEAPDEDMEVLSPMELAFKRAMEAEGIELNVSKKKSGKRGRRESNRSLQDEIIARTLSSGNR
jgi:small subunit ribosomal protein S1